MQRLVLDLRDNPGGPLDQAIAVVEPVPASAARWSSTRAAASPNSDEDYRADERGRLHRRAAHRAGQPQQRERVGDRDRRDAGSRSRRSSSARRRSARRSCSRSIRSANGAGLALTTGRYYTPSGRMIQRPWDGAFDEYLTYSLARSEGATRPHAAAELKYTDGGRKVYSGGGIEPDHFMPGRSRASTRRGSRACCATAARSSASPSGSPRKATRGPARQVGRRRTRSRRAGR